MEIIGDGATVMVTVAFYECRPHTKDNNLITGDGIHVCVFFSDNGGYVVFKDPISVNGGC